MPKLIKPTDELRALVQRMVGNGFRQEDIGRALDITPKALRKHYGKELKAGVTIANDRVAQALYLNATEKNNVTAQIFWLKARAGWREAQGPQLLPEAPDGFDLAGLSENQLVILERTLRLVATGPRPENPAALPRPG